MDRPSFTLITLLHYLLFCAGEQQDIVTVFDVVHYGAVGDGLTDDTQAFARAWEAARQQAGPVDLVAPQGKTFLVGQSKFKGPCNASLITFKIFGTILSPNYDAWINVSDRSSWLAFQHVISFHIVGSGVIDGRGSGWWPHNCKISKSKPCDTDAPAALTVGGSRRVEITGLTIINAARVHVVLSRCVRCTLTSLNISSPGDSPNNDGIHIGSSEHVNIADANIAAGDDCISIASGCTDMNITNINCGPGHGISIGSLGIGGTQGTAQWIHVKNATFTGTSNGARIKTWQGGFGFVKNVVFEGLQFYNVSNPIIIDQFYCDKPSHQCREQKSAVQISEVSYVAATGTSHSDLAINLHCSSSVACTSLLLQDVSVTNLVPGRAVRSFCNNAQGTTRGTVTPPVPCLSPS